MTFEGLGIGTWMLAGSWAWEKQPDSHKELKGRCNRCVGAR